MFGGTVLLQLLLTRAGFLVRWKPIGAPNVTDTQVYVHDVAAPEVIQNLEEFMFVPLSSLEMTLVMQEMAGLEARS